MDDAVAAGQPQAAQAGAGAVARQRGRADGGGGADGAGQARDVLGRVADHRRVPAEHPPHPAVRADDQVAAREGVVHQHRRAGLRGELHRRGLGELAQPRRLELVGLVEQFDGLPGRPPQGLQGARRHAGHAQRLGLPYRHLVQSGEQGREVGLADGGHGVLLRRAAGQPGLQRAQQAGRPLALRHPDGQRHGHVGAHHLAQTQLAAPPHAGRAVRGEMQHVPGADQPGGEAGAVARGPHVEGGGRARAVPAVLEQGPGQPADGVNGGCRCLGHGRAVAVRERQGGDGAEGPVGAAQSTITISRSVSFSRRPPSSVTVTMSSIRTPNRPGR